MDLLTLDQLPAQLRDTVTVRELQPGQALFHQGDPVAAFFLVETGRVKLLSAFKGEEMAIVQMAGAGDSLGEIALFTDTYPCTAIADIRSRVIAYPKPQLLLALHDHPELAEDFLVRLVQKIESLQLRLGLRDVRTAHDRVMRYLRYLAEVERQAANQNLIQFNRPLKDVAIELGLAPETLSRALARLEREGRISRQNQRITLHNSSAA